MTGIAQQLFLKKGHILAENFLHGKWPLLEAMQKSQELPYVDYALAQYLLKAHPEATEAVAAFLCHLSTATRQGHLCIRIDQGKIEPDAQTLWQGDLSFDRDLNEAVSSSQLDTFNALALEGAATLPLSLVTAVDHSIPSTPICRFGPLFYLQRYWAFETLFLNRLQQIMHTTPALTLDAAQVSQQIEILLTSNLLVSEQAEALRRGCLDSFTIISGGPGTGKTYTAGLLIKTFWEALSPQQQKHCEIVLAAPTGKAAANLQKSLQQATTNLVGFPTLTAKTLHNHLNLQGSRRKHNHESEQLTADLILVDESSMIDAKLFSYLLTAIKPGARLILLGDRHQLPPVAAGALFGDLVTSLPHCATLLTKCLRTELVSIVSFADKVNTGESSAVLEFLNRAKTGVERIALGPAEQSSRQWQNALVDFVMPYLPITDPLKCSSEELLALFNRFRILSPLRQGSYGADEINQLLMRRVLRPTTSKQWCALPIMVIRNDARLDLANGEVGVLVKQVGKIGKESFLAEGDYALFPAKSRDEDHATTRRIPAILLPSFEYAYCLSVHKSQGSEFDQVLLLMPKGAEAFGREVLYTAVTRARKKLQIWGCDAVLTATLSRQSHRLSGLSARLGEK